MNDAETYWIARAQKLRRVKGLCPLTPAEAEAALSRIPPRQASDDEIDLIVEAISRDVLPDIEEQSPVDWSPEYDHEAIETEAVLFRNEGQSDTETDAIEDELLEELLRDDDEASEMEG